MFAHIISPVNSTDNFELDISTLRHPDSAKWTRYEADVLPLWVADMDFAIAPSIKQALVDRLNSPIGYHRFGDPDLEKLLRDKFIRMGFSAIPDGGLEFLNGVVQGLFAAVATLTAPGEDVLTMTPIYPPFLWAISNQGRNLRLAPLADSDRGWVIDWDAMESSVTPATRLLMLCHPHNPTGRVWNRDELGRIADFALRHKLFVVTDELHADLTLDGPFVPFAVAAPPALRQRIITLTGPCKTYNTAGLGIGVMVSDDPSLIARMKKTIQGIGGHPSTLSFTMWKAGLRDDGQWLENVMQKLRQNRETLQWFIAEHLPTVRFFPPQGTYLAWLDFRAHSHAADIQKYLLEQAKVALNAGPDFGPGYEGFVRLNFATSPAILDQALRRIGEGG